MSKTLNILKEDSITVMVPSSPSFERAILDTENVVKTKTDFKQLYQALKKLGVKEVVVPLTYRNRATDKLISILKRGFRVKTPNLKAPQVYDTYTWSYRPKSDYLDDWIKKTYQKEDLIVTNDAGFLSESKGLIITDEEIEDAPVILVTSKKHINDWLIDFFARKGKVIKLWNIAKKVRYV